MKGDFKADFSRDTYDQNKHFLRVLMQQGRVQLDADWNEQMDILLHYMQTLAWDLIGPHGGPKEDCGFGVLLDSSLKYDFKIGNGRYYVDGILCENDHDQDLLLYSKQYTNIKPLEAGNYLVYLDVWEGHITCVEDESIREVALCEADTATRSKVIWQVKAEQFAGINCESIKNKWPDLVNKWQPRGKLKAKAKTSDKDKSTDYCNIMPEASYRGAENQLYRVEVHKAGLAGVATFKWSRENGSVVFPILKLEDKKATLANLGRDDQRTVSPGDWLEVVDDDQLMSGQAGYMFEVEKVDRMKMCVTFKGDVALSYKEYSKNHPLLRRWDYRLKGQKNDGKALIIEEKTDDDETWIELEDGIQIQFQKPDGAGKTNQYRTGDYWLIPARTATGDVDWPGPVEAPEAMEPHGVEHHYAPLAIIQIGADGAVSLKDKCRCLFDAHANCGF
jgi:hypothetical protein